MLNLPNVTLLTVDDYARGAKPISICQEYADFASTVIVPKIDGYEVYNRFCIKELADKFESEFVLTVQWDGFIVNPKVWTDEFLEYDYIGAPIWNNEVGCGGFSLRSKKFCEVSATLDLSVRNYGLLQQRQIREKDYPNEDFILCIERRSELEAMGIRFAPVGLASRFAWSYEGGRGMYNGAFGFHSPESMRILRTIGIIE